MEPTRGTVVTVAVQTVLQLLTVEAEHEDVDLDDSNPDEGFEDALDNASVESPVVGRVVDPLEERALESFKDSVDGAAEDDFFVLHGSLSGSYFFIASFSVPRSVRSLTTPSTTPLIS